MRLTRCIIFSLGLAFFIPCVSVAETSPVLLKASRLIDGHSAAVWGPSSVLVQDGKILALNPSSVPQDARVIDLGDRTVMPGLIDAHVHLTIRSGNYQRELLEMSQTELGLLALHSAQALLRSGWTTVRSAGEMGDEYPHFMARRWIEQEEKRPGSGFVGPRILGAGKYISCTGGGGDINFLCPCLQGGIADGLIVDGAEDMMKAVRREIKNGANFVKLLVTGAFMSAGDNPQDTHFSDAEVQVAVDEAARRRVPVMAHAHSAAGILMALKAGVRTIEHGTFIDQQGIEEAIKRDIPIIPTLYIGEFFVNDKPTDVAQQKMIELTLRYRDQYMKGLSSALRQGVRMGVGSDLGGYEDPSKNVGELGMLVELGLSPMQAIQAATSLNADILGLEGVGSLQPGYLADIIAVEGDPTQALIPSMEKVSFVMKAGRVVTLPTSSVSCPDTIRHAAKWFVN